MNEHKTKPTILVVDDILSNIEYLYLLLKNDYNIITANNGAEALILAAGPTPPDLILLDIMMPEMDGYEVCKQLKKHPGTQKIPLIFVTALDDGSEEYMGLELGAVDYIRKPINPSIVKVRIKTHLELKDQRQNLERMVRIRTEELNESRLQIIHRLGHAAEYKDNETGKHIIRMSKYAMQIAMGSGMNEDNVDLILNASPMHDVGKIGIPDNILQKKGKLDKNEWDIMTRHTQYGYQIIGDHDSELLKTAAIVAFEHHERWDGKGYPRGLKGEDINLNARIVAIADVFDALTSKRPYKEPWPVDKAIDLLQNESGKQFDPQLVPVFIESMPETLKVMEEFAD